MDTYLHFAHLLSACSDGWLQYRHRSMEPAGYEKDMTGLYSVHKDRSVRIQSTGTEATPCVFTGDCENEILHGLRTWTDREKVDKMETKVKLKRAWKVCLVVDEPS